jgi:hypothetical protein
MSSEPPRRPPPAGGGFYHHPAKPTKKRPRDTARATSGEADASAAADNAPPPPNLRQLRRENARRWEEVVRLRERLVQRETALSRRGGDLPGPAAAAAHGPIGDGDSQQQQQQQEDNSNRSSDQLGPLDRRLVAHRAELALLIQQPPPPPSQQPQQAEEEHEQQEQNRDNERSIRAVQAHRSMIQNARRHQAQLFGNEIVETYDGLAQLHAHLDRTIGIAPRDNNNAAAATAEENGAAGIDEEMGEHVVGDDRSVLTLHDRVAESQARVEEHRLIHTALMDMVQRRRRNATRTSEMSRENDADGVVRVADAVAETDAADDEVQRQRIHAELTYFAQRFDAHLDRMEQVATTAALEERQGDTLSDDEYNGCGNHAEGGANLAIYNGAIDRAGTGNNNNNNGRPSSTSSSSSQNPFLATLFVDLARRMVTNREDPYVSVEASVGAPTGAISSSSSRNRRIERRGTIIDHLLTAGVLIRHADNPDLICFNYFE